MEITVSKKDVFWSYAAQFFNLATGLITLPLILKLLNSDEVGLNYILISINSIVALFDLGFSGQFSRYLTYIFSGAQKIQKEGISEDYNDNINEHLLACTIKTAKRIYLIISIVASVFLITFGTWYVYGVTNGFSLIHNALLVWCIFCASSFFNIYFLYFNAFLQGRGLVKETKQAQVCSRLCQITLTFILLFAGYGLLSVVIANLIAPFVLRFFAYKKFYTRDIKDIVSRNKVCNYEIKEIFAILWHNAKKMGVIGVLSSAIGYASTLVIGSYLSLSDVASYGLMVQIVGIITGVATIHFYSLVPKLSYLMVKKDYVEMRRHFGISIFSFLIISGLGAIAIICVVPLFELCDFNTQFPSYTIIVLFYLYKFAEQNQSIFSQLFLLGNDLRFYKSAVWTGLFSFVSLWLSLVLGFGLAGVVISQSIPLYVYAAWKWPIDAVIIYKISPVKDLLICPYYEIKKIVHEKYFREKKLHSTS